MKGFHKWRWRLLAIWVCIFTILTALGLHIAENAADYGVKSRKAICALVQDERTRINNSKKFLKTHPKGAPGIATPADIRLTIKNQQQSVKVLNDEVHCP